MLKGNPIQIVDKILTVLLYKLIKRVERKFVQNAFVHYEKTINLNQETDYKTISVCGIWSKSKLFLEFTKTDLEKIKQNEFDCLVRCGKGIIRGQILNTPRHGILSFHHGDNRKMRGGPGGFWEVLHNHPSSGFIIQKLNNELDGGEILARGNLMTMGLWLQNNEQLLEKSNFFFKKLLKYIAINKALPLIEGPRLHDQKLCRLHCSLPLLSYCIKILTPKIINKIIAKIMGHKVARWSVAYAAHNNFNTSLWRYKEIENPKGRFLADPFIFEKNKTTYIFVEDLFYSDNKGRISVIKINENGHELLGIALEEDFHLSFPYIFESEGHIFMVPETHEKKDIRLYKCTEFPMKWTLEKTLMKNVSAVDTMLIFKDEKWFMLTNICSAGLGEHQSELHIFWSSNLQSNKWQPIKQGNPVIFDSLSARNGGLFYHNNTPYRINQVHGKNHYGKSFGINKINQLNTEYYSEKRISTINGDFKKTYTPPITTTPMKNLLP